jgi:hypothetical protein
VSRKPMADVPRELNFAVQRTIDRLIFLRICEDRGIEHYAFLQSLVNGERVYPRLVKHFRDADDRYNSGLFHFRKTGTVPDRGRVLAAGDCPAFSEERAEPPDLLTLELHIDDRPLKEIIGSLYYPDCPYEFSVLPADILGQVYEQFLGKVIRLTPGHQAKVGEKPRGLLPARAFDFATPTFHNVGVKKEPSALLGTG